MTAEEIREYVNQHVETEWSKRVPQEIATFRMLGEIAAQLAEQNERNARAEKLAMRIGEKSLAMMERTEKSMDKLDADKN